MLCVYVCVCVCLSLGHPHLVLRRHPVTATDWTAVVWLAVVGRYSDSVAMDDPEPAFAVDETTRILLPLGADGRFTLAAGLR